MKTLKKGSEIVRKDNESANSMVKKDGWFYCKKSEWKKAKGIGKKVIEVKVPETVKEVSVERGFKKPVSAGYAKYKAKKSTDKAVKVPVVRSA